jgi:MCP family monocarboxylic acid transporter-like MFS transporter 10
MVPTMFVAAIMTVAWPFATTVVSTIIVALIYGFACGTFVSLIVIPTAHMGEISDVGRRTGMQGTILAIGALAGPPASGAIATAAGSYVPLGIFAGALESCARFPSYFA